MIRAELELWFASFGFSAGHRCEHWVLLGSFHRIPS